MEIFEVHITGNKNILELSKEIPVKTIEIELFTPDKKVLRTEYMTSQIIKAKNYLECLSKTSDTLKKLFLASIHRVKIECPPYFSYFDKALYVESHFEAVDSNFPLSKNVRKSSFLGTARTYKKSEFQSFVSFFNNTKSEVEFCLFDSYVDEDKDWMDLYNLNAWKFDKYETDPAGINDLPCIKCKRCNNISFHPKDVKDLWCQNCD